MKYKIVQPQPESIFMGGCFTDILAVSTSFLVVAPISHRLKTSTRGKEGRNRAIRSLDLPLDLGCVPVAVIDRRTIIEDTSPHKKSHEQHRIEDPSAHPWRKQVKEPTGV